LSGVGYARKQSRQEVASKGIKLTGWQKLVEARDYGDNEAQVETMRAGLSITQEVRGRSLERETNHME